MELPYKYDTLTRPINAKATWWKRRSTSERILTVVICVVAIVCITLAIEHGFVIMIHKSQNICSTSSCIHIASDLLKHMDQSIDPCDNFYQFACGRFHNSTIIPHNSDKINSFTILRKETSEQLNSVMIEPTNPTDFNFIKNAKNLYTSCLNMPALNEKEGYDPLLGFLKKLGGWPVLDGNQWNETQFDWKESVYKFRETGYLNNYFMNIIVWQSNNSNLLIKLDKPSLSLSRKDISENLGNETASRAYMKMVNIAVSLGAERERAEKELLESFKFERELANIPGSLHEQVNSENNIYSLITIGNLTELYPSIPWKDYINRLLPYNTEVGENQIISIWTSFIVNFQQLINVTSKRVQANYVMWRAVNFLMSQLNSATPQDKYDTTLPKREACIANTLHYFRESVSYMYLRRYFDENTKTIVSTIVTNVKSQFLKIIQKATWLDEKSRKGAEEKLANLSIIVAYPEHFLDHKTIEKLHNGLELNDTNYLENILKIMKFQKENYVSGLRKLLSDFHWSWFRIEIVNASYNNFKKIITIRAGMLQGPFFNIDAPQYINYGAIGSIIGHEIIHGFDFTKTRDHGFGSDSNWSTPTVKDKFREKAQCIIDQYNNYTVKEVGMAINGFLTQHENIADNVGVKIAYSAYNHWLTHNGPELQFPGLPYTNRQMFWISKAREYCSKDKLTILRKKMKVNPHSPKEFRIIGALSNTPEFSKDFNCPVGSKMNPKNKCSVW